MRKKQKIINLYNDYSICSIKYVISIQNEEDLNNFWNFINTNDKSKYTLMNNFVSMFYDLAHTCIVKNNVDFFEIILEESENDFYFTFWNKKIADTFEEYLKKTSTDFIKQGNRISIKLDKSKQEEKIHTSEIEKTKMLDRIISKNKDTSLNISPYSFITDDDLDELLTLNEDMQEIMTHANKYCFNDSLFISLRSSLSMFCLTLRYYDSISDVANYLTDFSNTINTNKHILIGLNTYELSLISGLINNIDTWIKVLFVSGGADLHFMDDSIKADCETITQMFIPQCELDNFDDNMDDIFNF